MSDFSLHQPPNPDDLRRFPPAGPECARVRGLMRDFVDGDLGAAGASTVEEHVHSCRRCAVALSRSEHELMLVQKAFWSQAFGNQAFGNQAAGSQASGNQAAGNQASCSQGSAGSGKAPRGFRAAVMQRLLREEGGVGDGDEAELTEGNGAELAGPAEQAAGQNAARGDKRARTQVVAAARFLVSMPGSLTLGVMLLAVLVLMQSFGGEDRAPQRMARLVITSWVDAHTMFGDRQVRLTSPSGLGDGLVWVGAEGLARGDWHDASQRSQPAAKFAMDSNTAMRLRDGEPVLMNGKLRVDARRAVSIAVADGSRLELGVGEYILTASSSRDQDWDPSAGAPDDLEVGIEVLHGDTARIVRDGAKPIVVGAGSIGIYAGGAVDIQSGPNQQGAPIRGPDPIAVGPQVGSFRGIVWERSGLPAIGSDVLVSYRNSGLVQSAPAVVDSSGFFVFETGRLGAPPLCESPFAVVQVIPPAHRGELGLTAPEAYRVGGSGWHVHLQETLVLDVSFELAGVVVDEIGEPMHGVRLIPCVVDEIFGCVLPWPEGQASTRQDGSYVISRLPARLPRHQSLVIVLTHPELEPTAVTVPVRSGHAANAFSGRLIAKRLRTVRLEHLPVHRTVQIWQDIPGLPPGSAARVYTADTNGEGVIESLMVGPGRLFMRNSSPSHPMLRELVLWSVQPGQRIYRPANGAPQPFGAVYEMQQVVPGTTLALAGSYRHQNFRSTGSSDLTLNLFGTSEPTGASVPAAQLFAIQAGGPRGRGSVRFLGFSSMAGAFDYRVQENDLAVFMLSPTGAVLGLDIASAEIGDGVMPLRPTGRVVLDPSLRPLVGAAEQAVTILFEPVAALPGIRPVFRRFAVAAKDWTVTDVPPGQYRATIGETAFAVTVQSGGTTVLE